MMPDSTGWHPITLPDLGVKDQPIRVSTWLTQIGEEVAAGEAIVEVLLTGITFDVAAPVSGQLRRIDRFGNDHIRPGDVLGWLA
jgi:pyruvate/2-oxoglutarate dehydrogenase complex dihydrolipoamide acyltransferase (E2) component